MGVAAEFLNSSQSADDVRRVERDVIGRRVKLLSSRRSGC
jgi:hypothetical protein